MPNDLLRVFMVLPRIGPVEDESRQAAYLYPSRRRISIVHRNSKASLLAYGLNVKWAEMENGCSDDGCVSGVYDYFCILHADMNPQKFWLDTLMDEMLDYDLDCIHAAVAIKDRRRHSSTAIGTDRTKPIRKLTVKEIERLPRTFTSGDVRKKFDLGEDAKLLPNTGCFLLRVTDEMGDYRPWVREFPGFTIKDWFERKGRGKTLARVVSEDWMFGFWAASACLRVGGTRAIEVGHIGSKEYRNRLEGEEAGEETGEETDVGYLRMVANRVGE